MLCNFSHSGETVTHNSFALFHDLEGNMTVLSFGIDWNIVRKKIKTPSVATEKILEKLLSTKGNSTQMTLLDITKEDAKCHYLRNFDHEGLQDLSFFID